MKNISITHFVENEWNLEALCETKTFRHGKTYCKLSLCMETVKCWPECSIAITRRLGGRGEGSGKLDNIYPNAVGSKQYVLVNYSTVC